MNKLIGIIRDEELKINVEITETGAKGYTPILGVDYFDFTDLSNEIIVRLKKLENIETWNDLVMSEEDN